MAEEESPLIKALPPASDYLTYLTIVEYNLTKDNLAILHRVLQDETLSTNIGWDLVHLLVPLLPESELCLQDIARLGNPREVILKVTESLRLIEYESLDHSDDEGSETEPKTGASTQPAKTKPVHYQAEASGTQAAELPPPLPLQVNQFIALLSMLSTLHPRIKTKYPSRFISTTLQAILSSFSAAQSHREEMVLAIVRLIKSVSGVQRPVLPSRQSSGMLSSGTTGPAAAQANSQDNLSAPDPEAATAVDNSPEELATRSKLLQSFVTHILEEYMLNLAGADDVPGMAWCSRIMEKLHPERIIPGTSTFVDRFKKESSLQRRIDAIGQLAILARDLELEDHDLLSAAIEIDKVAEKDADEEEPPASAAEIPLSRLGSLLLYTARQASSILYDMSRPAGPPFDIFPDHRELLKQCLSSPAGGTGTLGTEPEALIDAILTLSMICLERDAIGEPASDEQFNEYLQVTALLSSNCPSPNLRGHAHYLTSTVLRSQPDAEVRLAFIRDTLENCPFENLKVSAVGWIKGETIEANLSTPLPGHRSDEDQYASGEDSKVFATPLALDSLAPFLFPSLQADLITAPVQDAFMTFQANLSFYLASLNFAYLLLHAKQLHQTLAIPDLWQNNDLAGSFMQPLRDASSRFGTAMTDVDGELHAERTDELTSELELLNGTLERVTSAVGKLNEG